MTPDRLTDDVASSSDPQVRKPMPVVIDPNFVRVIADHTVVMNQGRDADLSFLAFGSAVQSVTGIGDEDADMMGVEVRPQLNEVARVRMPPLIAVMLAMQILREYAQRGGLNTAMVIEQIREWSGDVAADTQGEQA